MISFRSFRREYKLNHQNLARLLGFQYGPTAAPEVPIDDYMHDTLETFWKAITSSGSPDPSTQFSNHIHNLEFRYLQMILPQTFFGRSETSEHISAEELFILFCII